MVAKAGQTLDQTETSSFDVTRKRVHYLEHTWTIDCFVEEAKNKEWLASQIFELSADPRYAFYLRLYPHGIDETSKDYVSLYLRNVTDDIEQFRAQYRFSILDQNGSMHNIKSGMRLKKSNQNYNLIQKLI